MAKNKTFSFAHLFGGSVKATEDDDDKQSKKGRKAKGRAEEEDRDDKERDDDAEDDRDDDKRDEDAEDDDSDSDADDADDDDDTDPDAEEDDGDDRKEDKATRQARQSERRRCARIFGSKYAAGNISLAASLAFNTGMSSSAAIDVLKGNVQPQSSGSRRVSLDERMSQVKNHRLGNDDDNHNQSGASSVVARATALYNQVKGKK